MHFCLLSNLAFKNVYHILYILTFFKNLESSGITAVHQVQLQLLWNSDNDSDKARSAHVQYAEVKASLSVCFRSVLKGNLSSFPATGVCLHTREAGPLYL